MTLNLSEKLSREFGDSIREGSMISNEHYVAEPIDIINPKIILEIGTLFGCSAAMFSQYADKVISIDIVSAPKRNREKAVKIWQYLGIEEKIQSYVVSNDNEKIELLANLNFDMAFIDGGHKYEEVQIDFSCVKKCGVVLFHDYKPSGEPFFDCNNIRYDEIAQFVDGLYPPAFIWGPHCGRFALWIDTFHQISKSHLYTRWKTRVKLQK